MFSTIRDLHYVVILWDSECNAVIVQWHGGFKGRDLRAGLDAGLEEFWKHPGAAWIGDTTEIGVIGREDQDWVNTHWYPRFLSTGVRSMAVVQPAQVIARMSVDQLVASIPGGQLTVCNCSTLYDARAWILKQGRAVA
jgi:hypothetical protein